MMLVPKLSSIANAASGNSSGGNHSLFIIGNETSWNNNNNNDNDVNNHEEGHDDHSEDYVKASIVRLSVLIAGSLSITGCSIIFISYACWKDIRTFGKQMLIFLTISDFLTASGNVFGVARDFIHESGSTDHHLSCVIQSAVTTFSSMASFFWTVSIGLYIFICVSRVSFVVNHKSSLQHPFHFVNWGIPAIVTAAAAFDRALGDGSTEGSGGWCWININHPRAQHWMILSGKVWEIIALLIVPWLYCFTKRQINQKHEEMMVRRLSKSMRDRSRIAQAGANVRLTLIPLLFLLCRIWGTLRFVLQFFGYRTLSHNVFLLLCHGIGDSSQGTANCLLFCLMTDKIRRLLHLPIQRKQSRTTEIVEEIVPKSMDKNANFDRLTD